MTMNDIISDADAKKAIAAGMPLPHGSGRNLTAREKDVAELVKRLAAVGGDVAKLSTVDQMNYQIYKVGGEIKEAPPEDLRDKIEAGLRAGEAKHKDELAATLPEFEALATEALNIRRKATWSSFAEKRAAQAKSEELLAKFAELEGGLPEKLKLVADGEFRDLVAKHLNQLKKSFSVPLGESE